MRGRKKRTLQDYRKVRYPEPLWDELVQKEEVPVPKKEDPGIEVFENAGAGTFPALEELKEDVKVLDLSPAPAQSAARKEKREKERKKRAKEKKKKDEERRRKEKDEREQERAKAKAKDQEKKAKKIVEQPTEEAHYGDMRNMHKEKQSDGQPVSIKDYLEKNGTVPWGEFWKVFTAQVNLEPLTKYAKVTDIKKILSNYFGARNSNEITLEKYQKICDFFNFDCGSEKNVERLLHFYKEKILGKQDYIFDEKTLWFQGALSEKEEESLLARVPPQTFLVTVGADNTFVFAYNDYDDDNQTATSTFLIAIYYNAQTNLFEGMDMENPEFDDDVEYDTLDQIAALFTKLNFKPLHARML
eukprot:TRINITY_DN12515_c0_g1_i1.p1 TRINITY_DN12515_c0_g1~~TRINITY_DN12515_c0_g1_i1.p1  ORF type:complete len:358 (+),score=96.16 TRINITY_DN12515_c0_g1_i1:174-1247(+)